jgi:hypothetical protein
MPLLPGMPKDGRLKKYQNCKKGSLVLLYTSIISPFRFVLPSKANKFNGK